MRRNWPFFKDSDWLILVFVHSAKPTAELENLAMSPSLSSPGLSYDTKFVHIGWELRSSLVGDTILGVQSEPACTYFAMCIPIQSSILRSLRRGTYTGLRSVIHLFPNPVRKLPVSPYLRDIQLLLLRIFFIRCHSPFPSIL